ncbi:UDP-4-amino-4,6-dideoxy-N-acetyl-beta-L-altrosamine N-acetyltransferase [Lysinibacillus sp. NPDC093210]|uniref:UDP-4-amino-4, 6-dideoxy-N-acetyl-beta-L-altrosamine N-acetyltransferase n=1 Tax=Lysinibacillus sp. NPDC093210 TaxID=3364133 RepID=UPI0037F346BE
MNWLQIEEKHLKQILDWRTSEEVTRFMYTDIEYNIENQNKWFSKIRDDKNGYYWLMEYRNELIGFISITDINWMHKRGTWNFYIGNKKFTMLAGFIGAYVYNFAFTKLGLLKLNGEVLDINKAVQKLHIKQGAREVGILEHHILKNGVWHDVYMFEMTKQRWQVVGVKFNKYIAEVEL